MHQSKQLLQTICDSRSDQCHVQHVTGNIVFVQLTSKIYFKCEQNSTGEYNGQWLTGSRFLN